MRGRSPAAMLSCPCVSEQKRAKTGRIRFLLHYNYLYNTILCDYCQVLPSCLVSIGQKCTDMHPGKQKQTHCSLRVILHSGMPWVQHEKACPLPGTTPYPLPRRHAAAFCLRRAARVERRGYWWYTFLVPARRYWIPQSTNAACTHAPFERKLPCGDLL